MFVFLVLAMVGFFYRTGGHIGEVALSSDRIGEIDRIRISVKDSFFLDMRKEGNGRWVAVSSEGNFEPDQSRIADFLQMLNMWDIQEVVEDSLARNRRSGSDEETFGIVLRSGFRAVRRWTGFVQGGEVYVDAGKDGLWRMHSPWVASSWKDFFMPSTELWKNRMLVDWNYYEIASVRVRFDSASEKHGASYCLMADTSGYVLSVWNPALGRNDRIRVDSMSAESYLSSFRQVYFDRCDRENGRFFGQSLCVLEIVSKRGERMDFRMFGRLDEDGNPDLFKVLVVRDDEAGDTVVLPYVVLDKMIKEPAWFGR